MEQQDASRGGAHEHVPFGELLRRFRHAASLTQGELAVQAGLSERGISDLERGVNRAPRPATLRLLAVALALSARERALLETCALRQGSPPSAQVHLPSSPATLSGAAPARRHSTSLDWHHASPAGAALPPFVARQREMGLLAAHLAGHGPPVLVLAGQPGIGKTRLLQEAHQQALAANWTVLAGGCQRGGGEQPYGPLQDALARYIDGLSPLHVRTALRGCAWLVRLLPELADAPIEPLPAWQLSTEHARRLLFRAVARFLTNIGGPAGTLLLLDDLHWASSDSLELLTFLLHAPRDAPLRVVGAYRDTEVQAQDPMAVLLADLARSDLAQHVRIGPLALEEARRLVEALVGEQSGTTIGFADQLLLRLGGVPFFVVHWARSLQDTLAESRPADLPWTVGQSIRQRAAALPGAAQEVLAAAAVLGRVVSQPLLGAMCGLEPAALMAALDAACRAQLLEQESPITYRFVHDVIGEALESDLGPARRASLHQRAGEALARAPGAVAVEALAFHFARGETAERALPYLEQAGDTARAQYANAAAAGYYRELITLLEARGHRAAQAAVCEKLGSVFWHLTNYEEELAALEWAAAYYAAAGASEDLGRVTAHIGRNLGRQGLPQQGLARLQPHLAALEARGPSPALAHVHLTRSHLYQILFLPREQLAAGTRAVEIARQLQDTDLLATALVQYGNTLVYAGRVPEALRTVEEGRRLAESLGDLKNLMRVWSIKTLGHYALGELDASRHSAGMQLAAARRLGDPAWIASALVDQGRPAFLMGEWSQARGDLEDALALARKEQAPLILVHAAVFLGEFYLAAGRWEEAEARLEEVLALTESRALSGRYRHAQALLAEHDLYRGRPEAALGRLLPLQDADNTFAPWIRTQLAWTYVELGEPHRALESVARALAQARAEQHRVRLVDALRVQAMALASLGLLEQATAALEEGLALASAIAYRYGEARLLVLAGMVCRQQGAQAQARERLRAALTLFRRMGAQRDSEQTEHLLLALGC